jgi:hypothetical protein
MNMPNRYFETGSAVCCVSMVTVSRSGTAGAGFCAAAAIAHPKQNAVAATSEIFVLIKFLSSVPIQSAQMLTF